MSAAVDEMKTKCETLSREERAELACFLIQSLDEEAEDGVEAAWEAELANRAAEIKSGKVAGRPAFEVLTEIRKKYS